MMLLPEIRLRLSHLCWCGRTLTRLACLPPHRSGEEQAGLSLSRGVDGAACLHGALAVHNVCAIRFGRGSWMVLRVDRAL